MEDDVEEEENEFAGLTELIDLLYRRGQEDQDSDVAK